MNERERREILARGASGPVDQGLVALGPWLEQEDIDAAMAVLRAATDPRVGFSGGPYIARFEEEFAAYVGTRHAIAVNSAGTGLDIAMKLLDLQPGDEVVTTPITYIATTHAILAAGGKPVFADIGAGTFNIDPEDVERKMSARTRAIMPVHNNGLSVDMDALLEIAARHPHAKHGPVPVMGDAARACGAGYKGTKVGKVGALNIFSFQTTKNLTTLGEGGMITSDDDALARRARRLRSFGWEGGELVEPGFNYRMTGIQAAVGSVQLRRLDRMNERRRERAHLLTRLLNEAVPEIWTPVEPEGYYHIYYGYTCMVPEQWAGEKRDHLLRVMMSEHRVGSVVMNPPVTIYPMLQRLGYRPEETPRAKEQGERLFCLPLHPLMSDQDLAYIAAALADAFAQVARG
ncbi:MAG: DegT/DnrJ/EryC1/StrS family aminotransferase [Anaerolineae bacterium]